MKGDSEKIVAFLEGSKKRFIIPVYQRNYNWKKEHCKILFNDLVTVIRQNKKSHFFGSIVSSCKTSNEILIIDGQQRVTTISLLMIAIINALKNNDIQSENNDLKDEIEQTYIIDRFSKKDRKVRLKPFRDDCDAFDKLIYSSPSEYIDNSNVTINYRYFYERIVDNKELSADELYEAIQKLEIIHIELEPDHGDDPQLIFESLNSTGLALTESDKIRNYILMGLDSDKQDEYYDKYWYKVENNTQNGLDAFIRHYLTIKTNKISNFGKIYFAFKDYASEVNNTVKLLDDILHYSNIYANIVAAKFGDKTTDMIVKRLNRLDMTVAYPFLMSYIHTHNENHWDISELNKVLSTIETYIFRRLICDYPTNALNKIFATLHRQIMKIKEREDVKYSDIFIYILENKTLSGTFPIDSEFIQGFVTKNVYAMHKKNRSYLFERLENGSSKEVNDVWENINNGNLTVEHIMPQTLSPAWKEALGSDYENIQERWLHTVANLTLTGYNSDYGNRTFQDKKTIENGFNQSGLRLNQYIKMFDKWTENELQQRQAYLSQLAKQIWGYPTTNYKPTKSSEELSVLLSDDFDFRFWEIKELTFMGTVIKTDSFANAFLKVIEQLYSLEPSILISEANNDSNVWIVNKQQTKSCIKIAEGVYANKLSDSNTKIRILKNLFEKYGIDEDDLQLVLKSPKSKKSSDSDTEQYKIWE